MGIEEEFERVFGEKAEDAAAADRSQTRTDAGPATPSDE